MDAMLGKIEQVAALRTCNSSNPRTKYSPILERLLTDESDQPRDSSCEPEAGTANSGHEPVPWLYVVDGRNPEADVMIFSYSHHCLLNVEHDAEGIGSWCRWHWPSAEVAFFEERDPQDPEYPRLKLIGVYPVRNGWARINLKETAGKGTDRNFPLYVMQRTAVMKLLGLSPRWGMKRELRPLKDKQGKPWPWDTDWSRHA